MSLICTRMLFIVCLLSGMAMAEGVTITRDVPATARFGEQIRITVSVTNHFNRTVKVDIEEQADNDVIEPKPVLSITPPGMIAARPPRIEWTLDLAPEETKDVYYIVLPKQVGDYPLAPTSVTAEGNLYSGEPASIKILCNANSICEPDLGENLLTCPHDCKSGGKDRFCDRTSDGKCDPDCAPGYDPDCETKPAANGGLMLFGEICIGIIVLLAIIAAAAFFISRRKKADVYQTLTQNLEEASKRPSTPPIEKKGKNRPS